MALGPVTNRQDVVGVLRRLVPGRRERGVQFDLRFVAQHLFPHQTVGVGPDRVIDAREVGRDLAAAVEQHVRQQIRELVMAERPFGRVEQLVPMLLGGGRLERLGHELVPAIGGETAAGAERAGEGVQQHQGAR